MLPVSADLSRIRMTIFLAVRRRQNRDTQIDLLAHHLDAETSILRHAALRDVETGENLDARRDRELERFWRRLRRDQFAVDAVAQFQRPLETARCEYPKPFP